MDLDLNVKKMKKKRLSEFRDVFKKDLGPDDRMKIDPVLDFRQVAIRLYTRDFPHFWFQYYISTSWVRRCGTINVRSVGHSYI